MRRWCILLLGRDMNSLLITNSRSCAHTVDEVDLTPGGVGAGHSYSILRGMVPSVFRRHNSVQVQWSAIYGQACAFSRPNPLGYPGCTAQSAAQYYSEAPSSIYNDFEQTGFMTQCTGVNACGSSFQGLSYCERQAGPFGAVTPCAERNLVAWETFARDYWWSPCTKGTGSVLMDPCMWFRADARIGAMLDVFQPVCPGCGPLELDVVVSLSEGDLKIDPYQEPSFAPDSSYDRDVVLGMIVDAGVAGRYFSETLSVPMDGKTNWAVKVTGIRVVPRNA